MDVYSTVEKREGLFEQINQYLEIFDLDEVDYNILNVFREYYDNDILGEVNSLSDLYKNYCMAYLKDADDFEHCAKMSYEYFMTNKRFTQSEIANNSSEWNLIHQHKTISNFLIAYYYVKKVKDFIGEEDMGALEFLFPMDVTIFIKPLINDKHETQKLIFEKCKQIYEKGRILAKSQSLYMMGRITYKNLRSEILSCLEGYYDILYEKFIEGESNQTEQEERDSQLLLRSVIISLVYLGRKDKRDIFKNAP